MTRHNLDLAKIHSMRELRMAQSVIDRRLEETKMRLRYDQENIKEMLTVEYWAARLLPKLSGTFPSIKAASSVFAFVFSLFGGRRCRR